MSLQKVAAGVCCVALLAGGVAEAKRLKIKNLPVDVFQGVDDFGDLDGGAYPGLIKLTVNLNNGRATVSGKAVVPNLSGERAVFTDEDFAGIGTLVHDRYVVKRNGKANYHGRYEDVVL
jgi:hypothetical protein